MYARSLPVPRSRPTPSAEPPGDIILGALILRGGEYFIGCADLDQMAEVKESGELRYPSRLLHRMGDDDDAEILLELVDELFDAGGGDGIERGTRLVHQNDLGIDGNGSGDAQALLLAARKAGARRGEAVLHLVEQAGTPETGNHDVVELAARAGNAVDTRSIGDILEDRFGKGIGLLKDHADTRAQEHGIEIAVVDILAVDLNCSLDASTRDRIVHAVDGAKKGGLAASRGPDEGRHRTIGNIDRQVGDGLLLAVEHIDIARMHLDRPRCHRGRA